MKTWLLGMLAVGGAVALANAASQAKCRARRRSLEKSLGTTDPVELAARIRALGGDVPDCTGFTLAREGI